MRRSDEKDAQIKELVENHFTKNNEVHERTIKVLDELPNKIVTGITSIYDPKTYTQGQQAYKKILKRR